jgi:hypothetical protein
VRARHAARVELADKDIFNLGAPPSSYFWRRVAARGDLTVPLSCRLTFSVTHTNLQGPPTPQRPSSLRIQTHDDSTPVQTHPSTSESPPACWVQSTHTPHTQPTLQLAHRLLLARHPLSPVPISSPARPFSISYDFAHDSLPLPQPCPRVQRWSRRPRVVDII